MIVATRAIKKGEEINICYGMLYFFFFLVNTAILYSFFYVGPQIGKMKRSERQAELRKKYFFVCTCPACELYVKLLCEVQC